MGKRGRPPKVKKENLNPSDSYEENLEIENEENLEENKEEVFEDRLEEVIEKPVSFQKQPTKTAYRFKSNVIHGKNGVAHSFKRGDIVKDNAVLNEIEIKNFLVNGLLEEIKI